MSHREFKCNRRWWISTRLKLWWSWNCLLALFQNLVCRQKNWYSIPFRGGAATTIQMLHDGEKCSILRWRGNNCADARIWKITSIPHVPATPNTKPQNSELLALFYIHKSTFLEFFYKAWPLICIPNPLIFLLLPSSFFKC